MTTALESLIQTGTKLWLDSVDPDLVVKNRALGITGATSNPVIVGDLIETGRFDDHISELLGEGKSDSEIAWALTDNLVKNAQAEFHDVWSETKGNNGWVSFELDPLIDAADSPMSHAERVAEYVRLGLHYAEGHDNRMIKVPATPAGIEALEELVANDVTVNVTLVFSDDQYRAARDSVWRGAQKRSSLDHFKSVYSIFISRIDVFTEKHVPSLSDAAQGEVGLLNAKRIWQENKDWWADKNTPLQQELIFASTGTKLPEDPKDKYVAALAGADIQTNPPSTNDAVQDLGKTYTVMIDVLPASDILDEIDERVDFSEMERVLMEEGLRKFADPQKQLLELIASKRDSLSPA